jgi:cytochrome c oxidase subunit 2
VGESQLTDPPPDAFEVVVRGHQWWWEYEYPESGVKTANEMHVPVNTRVYLRLESADVIHSFWVPRFAGKTDVIPGRTNIMWFHAQEEGIFQGNCAEYCGNQHANMLIRVVVQSEDAFQAWVNDQLPNARDDSETRRGRDVFLKNACVNCHTIRGTGADGTFGPDLTHLASRDTLASAMVANDEERLTQWVDNPQKIKPGCWMPSFKLEKSDVAEVVKYLRSLK